MKKRLNYYLIAVLFLALLLRFWKLGQVPHGMTWDEAAIGYNGFAIRTVHRDEWLIKMPISFRSFGDYKAPLAIYINGVFTWIFGLNLFAVRLPFALFSLAAILGIYLLFKEIFWEDKNKEKIAVAAVFILTLSPWHIHFSRLGFESGIALSILIWAIYFIYLYLRKKKLWFLLLGSFLAVLTLYVYHSSKLTVPLLVLFLLINNWQVFKKIWKDLLISLVFSMIIIFPLAKDAIFAEGLTRAGSSILMQGLSFFEILKVIWENLISYFSPAFLIFGENGGELRHSDARFGILNFTSFLLINFYFLTLFIKIFKRKKLFAKSEKKIFILAVAWLFLGLLPAIIVDEKFHSNRSFLALPAYIILAILGGKNLLKLLKLSIKNFLIILGTLYLIFTIFYQFNYYKNYAAISADAFADGYIDVFNYLKAYDKKDINKILFTNDYQHAYIYALFVNQLSPIAYHGGILALFEFNPNIHFGDLDRKNTIVVASNSDEMLGKEADHQILAKDGEIRFKIYLPQEK